MKVLQLSDRDGNEIVPVGSAAATYLEDGNSVLTITLLMYEILNTVNYRLSGIKGTVNAILVDLSNALRGIPYILKGLDEIENITLVGGYTYIWQSPIVSLSFNLEPLDGVETHYRMKFRPQAEFNFTPAKELELKGNIPTWVENTLYEVDIVSDPTGNYITVKEW